MAYQADSIRQFVMERYVRAFHLDRAKQLTIRAGDVARDMALADRTPNVCSVLGGRKLHTAAGLKLVWSGSAPSGQSTTMTYIYEVNEGD